MALQFGRVNLDDRNYVIGNRRQVVADITLDSSYPTGGYPLPLSRLGVDGVPDFVFANATTTGHMLIYNYSTQKLMVFTAGAEVANLANLSTVVVRVVAQGKGAGI